MVVAIGDVLVLRALIAAMALTNNAGQTALQLATKLGHKQIVELLTSAAADAVVERSSKEHDFLAWFGK